jgi:hypothetical protein
MGNKMKTFIVGTLIVVLLGGCAPLQQVHIKTTNFYIPEYKSAGSISVVSAKQELNESLEFASYKARFEAKLVQAGYTIANNPSEAAYVAFVAFGIDNGKEEVSSTPILGQTGGGSTYSSGTVGNASYYGSSYTMPSYGVVGTSVDSDTMFTRAIALDIVDAQSLKDGHPKKILEIRAKSIGTCSVIAGVFDEILEGMFEDFPGESGKVHNVNVVSKGNC